MFTIKKACICTAWPCKVNNILDRNETLLLLFSTFTLVFFYFIGMVVGVTLFVVVDFPFRHDFTI